MARAMITAFRTLTLIPLPGKDTQDLSRSLCFFPLVGAALGGVVLILYHGAALIGFRHPFLLALFSLALTTWLTGGLHLDGLGDVADAFGGGKTGAQILQILEDPRMGSFGVCAIVFDILIKAWCWQFYFGIGDPSMVLWSLVFSRCMQGVLIAFFPNARKGSIAAPFGQGAKRSRISVMISFLITAFAAAWFTSLSIAIVGAGTSLLITLVFGLYCWKRIQGITGDCVGATNEIAEISVLVGGMMIK